MLSRFWNLFFHIDDIELVIYMKIIIRYPPRFRCHLNCKNNFFENCIWKFHLNFSRRILMKTFFQFEFCILQKKNNNTISSTRPESFKNPFSFQLFICVKHLKVFQVVKRSLANVGKSTYYYVLLNTVQKLDNAIFKYLFLSHD